MASTTDLPAAESIDSGGFRLPGYIYQACSRHSRLSLYSPFRAPTFVHARLALNGSNENQGSRPAFSFSFFPGLPPVQAQSKPCHSESQFVAPICEALSYLTDAI